jgi:uncharacterized damage-inducible protein DinB
MNPLLRDLLDHQLWADVEHWNTMAAHSAAREDPVIHNRLHHVHLTQRMFVWVTGDRAKPFVPSRPEEFPSFDALRDYARDSHEDILRRRNGMSDTQLNATIDEPDFPKDPPLVITGSEALMQMAMHSQWHRGQNATRLRELRVEPPTVDLIVWYWKGRPSSRL